MASYLEYESLPIVRGFRCRQFPQRFQESWDVERFVADRIGPLAQYLPHGLIHLRAVAGDQDRARLRVGVAHQAEHGAAVAVGQFHVDQHDRERTVSQVLRRLTLIVGQADPVAALAEQVPEVGPQVLVVVDHHDQRLTQGLVHQLQELGKIDRLGEHLPRPGRERFLRRLAGWHRR